MWCPWGKTLATTGFMRELTALAAALTLALPGAPAQADVFEIADGGVLRVRADAGEVRWHGEDATAANEAVPIEELPTRVVTNVGNAKAPATYAAILNEAAAAYDISPSLLEAVVWQESRWRADALSPKGARGLAQLMPATARDLGVNSADPRSNLLGGAKYLRRMLDLFDGDIERALAAYNAGPGRVIKAGGIPAITETRGYVTNIIGRLTPAAAQSVANSNEGIVQ